MYLSVYYHNQHSIIFLMLLGYLRLCSLFSVVIMAVACLIAVGFEIGVLEILLELLCFIVDRRHSFGIRIANLRVFHSCLFVILLGLLLRSLEFFSLLNIKISFLVSHSFKNCILCSIFYQCLEHLNY